MERETATEAIVLISKECVAIDHRQVFDGVIFMDTAIMLSHGLDLVIDALGWVKDLDSRELSGDPRGIDLHATIEDFMIHSSPPPYY
jgi:hypothetical protein